MSSSDEPAPAPDVTARGHVTGWFVLSIVAHLALAGFAAFGLTHRSNEPTVSAPSPDYPPPPVDGPIVVELPPSSGDTEALARIAPVPEATPPSGTTGGKSAHADDGVGGKGGTVGAKATNLSSANADETVSEAVRDADEDQQNHLKTNQHRVSPLDVRHALAPMELTFVASGRGFRYERRPVAPADAALGAGVSKGAVLGGAPGGAPGAGTLVALGTIAGSKPSPIPGVSYGTIIVGTPQLVGANVGKARPHVMKGKPTVVAGDKGAVTKDDKDADQAVKDALASVVSTSPVGADEAGAGKGGSDGAGAPSSGGDSAGSASLALGTGGDGAAAKRTRWFLELQKRIGPLVDKTFPKAAELELRQGVVIVELTIDKAGKVLDVIVVRESGFAEFDKNVVTRLRGAPSFDPIPDMVGAGPVHVRLGVQGGWKLQ